MVVVFNPEAFDGVGRGHTRRVAINEWGELATRIWGLD